MFNCTTPGWSKGALNALLTTLSPELICATDDKTVPGLSAAQEILHEVAVAETFTDSDREFLLGITASA